MTAKTAGRATISKNSLRLFSALALVAGLGLGGCTDIDDMLFGAPDDSGTAAADQSDQPQPATQPATQPAAQPVAQSTMAAPTAAPSPPPSVPQSSMMPATTPGPVATITPVNIEPGSDTGTAVSKTVAGLRSQMSGLQNSLVQDAQRLADLRSAAVDAASAYHEAKARITTRLQIGTTRGNPELVTQWNTAQAALDQLTSNINALSNLGTAVANDSSTAHYVLDQVTATFNVSGAVDEDHRQLSVLQDETNQTIILIDRLLTEVSGDVQRQTAYVATERAGLTTLANAIKNGEFYGPDLGSPMAMSSSGGGSMFAYSGTPLVVIRFDHPDVDYQQILYAALSQALKTRPSATFAVVAVSPTRGTAAAVQLAQTAAHRHAQEVMRSMTDMGVPASRLTVASSTDPSASSSEVRVFVR